MVSLLAAVAAIGLAIARVVPNAVRLGTRGDSLADQSTLARSIFREHVAFIALMSTVLVVQLVGG